LDHPAQTKHLLVSVIDSRKEKLQPSSGWLIGAAEKASEGIFMKNSPPLRPHCLLGGSFPTGGRPLFEVERFAREVADRVVFMDRGSIVEEGDPDTFFRAPVTERARSFLNQIIH
jgi:hypothetical protein